MKRYPLPDLLKGFAVFLIVPVHILETFIDSPGRESLFGKILLFLGGPFAVPVFMMVMGYFVALSKKSFTQNIFRGVLIFMAGFLLNIGLNFHLLLKIQFEGWQFDPFQYIFGVDIFFLAGLSIVILTVLKTIKTGQEYILLLLVLFVSGATSFFNEMLMVSGENYFLPFIGGDYSWSYFPLFPWLAYPLTGFLFQKIESRIPEFFQRHRTISIILLLSIFIAVVVFSRFGTGIAVSLPVYYHHTFLFFLWTLGLDLMWILLLLLIVKKLADFPVVVFLRWLGKNITAFYIVQWLIIGNTATAIYRTQSLATFAWWFVVIFMVTVIIVAGYEKVKTKYLLRH